MLQLSVVDLVSATFAGSTASSPASFSLTSSRIARTREQ